MTLSKFLTGAVFAIFLTTGAAVSQDEQSAAPEENPAMNDLDEFMAKVLQKRRVDAENLREYVFSERESFEIKGSKIAALGNFRREYVWFVRDSYLVRSPVRIDGIKVSAKEQAAAEEEWIEGQKRSKKETSLDREAFFGFKFEPGRYLYAGEQEFEGRKAVVVEYYPKMGGGNVKKSKNSIGIGLGGLFEKTLLVTMLISPDEHQILRIILDNVGLEFLPARWLVRVNDIKASMVMDKPKGDIWLPREISAYGSASAANVDLSINYSREFYSYAKSDVKVKLWFGVDETEIEK